MFVKFHDIDLNLFLKTEKENLTASFILGFECISSDMIALKLIKDNAEINSKQFWLHCPLKVEKEQKSSNLVKLKATS